VSDTGILYNLYNCGSETQRVELYLGRVCVCVCPVSASRRLVALATSSVVAVRQVWWHLLSVEVRLALYFSVSAGLATGHLKFYAVVLVFVFAIIACEPIRI